MELGYVHNQALNYDSLLLCYWMRRWKKGHKKQGSGNTEQRETAS